MYDIVVIGGGVSGMTATLYGLRNGKKVLLLEGESIGGQIAQSPKVENFPTVKQISGSKLSDDLFEQITALGAEFEFDNVHKVEKKDEVKVTLGEDNAILVKVNKDDMGKVIGKDGRIAKAIRTIVKAVGNKSGVKYSVSINESDEQ